MPKREPLDDAGLAALAKRCREDAGKTRAQAARELNVSRPAIFHAEEAPDQGMTLLRRRIIEAYSNYTVDGPVYVVRKKRRAIEGDGSIHGRKRQ